MSESIPLVKWPRHLRPHNYLGPALDPEKNVLCAGTAGAGRLLRGRALRGWQLEELRSLLEARATHTKAWRRGDSEWTEGQESDIVMTDLRKGLVCQGKKSALLWATAA